MPRSTKTGALTALLAVLLTLALTACGGSSSSGGSPNGASIAGNWQFTVSPPPDNSFSGGLQGGFLLQNGGTISGAAVYAVSAPNIQPPLSNPCNSGSAPVTGTNSSQSMSFTAVAGSQTFTFSGTVSADSSTMMGTYSSTAGTASDGVTPCGTAQSNLQWSAVSVPPITGPVQGSFHSTGGLSNLTNQDFVVSGSLTQGQNIGASNATVTGTLTFIDPVTQLSVYPCFAQASVNGQISGSSVVLQIIATDGSIAGQIGGPLNGATGVNPASFDSVQGGYILHGAGPSYLVATKACPGSLGSTVLAGDFGNICLGLGTTTACQQPITLSPSVVTFPAQTLGAAPTTQTITLSNSSAAPLNGLTLSFLNLGNNLFYAGGDSGDFNPTPSFSEQDTCAASPGAAFSLTPSQSCSVTVTFSPQEACPWLPFPAPPSIAGAPPEYCPFPQSATVTIANVPTEDSDKTIAVPITGIGLSAIRPSTAELDFGAEQQPSAGVEGEASIPQTLSFTNKSTSAVQILGAMPCVNEKSNSHNTLPSPRLSNSPVAGLQVVSNDVYQILPDPNASPATITYRCDSDTGTMLANFQISSDSCTGTLLAAQSSCSVQIAYVPQPNTNVNSGLDYFLELNTVQCWPSNAPPADCEIDSGRFPVELKANTPSPLRMSPGAGLDFGIQAVGKTSAPLTVTLLNDPTVPDPQPVSFVGKLSPSGSYSESDDCPITLAPGSSCTLTVTFKPGSAIFIPGTITINYSPEPFGRPQFVYLRGTGQ